MDFVTANPARNVARLAAIVVCLHLCANPAPGLVTYDVSQVTDAVADNGSGPVSDPKGPTDLQSLQGNFTLPPLESTAESSPSGVDARGFNRLEVFQQGSAQDGTYLLIIGTQSSVHISQGDAGVAASGMALGGALFDGRIQLNGAYRMTYVQQVETGSNLQPFQVAGAQLQLSDPFSNNGYSGTIDGVQTDFFVSLPDVPESSAYRPSTFLTQQSLDLRINVAHLLEQNGIPPGTLVRIPLATAVEQLVTIRIFEPTAGLSQGNALKPAVQRDLGNFLFVAVPSDMWFDPAGASSFTYAMEIDGLLFNSIPEFPVGFGPMTIEADGQNLGTFNAGDSLDFVSVLGHGVPEFTVSGIDPPVDLEPNRPVFALKLAFNEPVATFTVQPNAPIPAPDSAAVPEPLGITVVGIVVALAAFRRR